ncbi:MAG: hypothetical protein JWP80_2232 [Pseudomonas sp.]|nr:hypothetical protein [Pseudomonas sp.]
MSRHDNLLKRPATRNTAVSEAQINELLRPFISAQSLDRFTPLADVEPFDGTYNIDGLIFIQLNSRTYEVNYNVEEQRFIIVHPHAELADDLDAQTGDEIANTEQVLSGWWASYSKDSQTWQLLPSASDKVSSSPIKTSMPSNRTMPLPSLPSLVNVLSDSPEFDDITTAVRRYIAQRHAYYVTSNKRPKGDRGVMEPVFQVSTLLQALTWERLEQTETTRLSLDGFRTLLGELLDSPPAKVLGRALHNALGWDEEIDAQQADPQLLKQLVWSALILEIEPPAGRRLGHIAGYDLTTDRNWGQPYDQIRANIVDGLQWKTRTVDGLRSSDMARLALCILEPLHPDFAVPDTPKDLMYGTLRWVNFAHGVALAEALRPDSSRLLTLPQLIELPLEQSENASEEALQIIAATRLTPAVQWAIAHGVLDHRQAADYSEDDLLRSVSALEEYSIKLSGAFQAVLTEPPDRIKMADQKLEELLGDRYHLRDMIMRPVSHEARLEYSLRNPSPNIRAGKFYLRDLFTAGVMKNGTDQFEPHFQSDEQAAFNIQSRYIEEKLKGVDIPALYDEAFKTYFDKAKAGYSVVIEYLFEQLPVADRIALNKGAVKVHAFQSETGETVQHETDQHRADHRGRFGFVIQSNHNDVHFSYEVFPLLALMKRRIDLPVLNADASYAQRPPGSRNINQIGTPANIDWAAYKQDTQGALKEPQDDVVSDVIVIAITQFEPAPARDTQSRHTLSSPRLKRIAEVVAQQHMFYDYHRAYSYFRGVSGFEQVRDNYPPMLRIVALFVPGVSCFNAIQTNESPAPTCLLDVGTVLAHPLVRLLSGTVRIGILAGQLRSIKVLSGLVKPARTFVIATRDTLNPLGPVIALGALIRGLSSIVKGTSKLSAVTMSQMASRLAKWAKLKHRPAVFRMPQRVNGRIGYPLSGRGSPSPLGRRINNVDEFDEFVAENDIFGGNAQRRADARADVVDGVEIRVLNRWNGTKTLVRKDSVEDFFIDLSNNKTVQVGSRYDYRVLKSWRVENEAAKPNVIRVPPNQIEPTRTTLVAGRLASLREAIENGTYLPALDVRKTPTGYGVINGNHRLQVALELGLETVPVIVH